MNETSAKKNLGDSREQILDGERRELLALEDETLPIPIEEGRFY